MKEAVKRIVRDEKGHGIDLVLILLGVGGLIMAPLLGLMSTGLLAGQVYERKTDELYAADAGVEDAVWKIQNEVDEVMGLTECYPDWSYNMSEVNSKGVEVTITYVTNLTYKVESIAAGNGSETQIEAYITGESYFGDYSGLMEHILTSPGEIDVAKKVILEYPEGAEPYPNYPDDWPQVWELEDFYGEQVEDGTQYYEDTTIDILAVNQTLGPLYVDGTLQIVNSLNPPATLSLNGTVYATGDTKIGTTDKEITFDLDGQTIFVSSNTTGNQKALVIGGQRHHSRGRHRVQAEVPDR